MVGFGFAKVLITLWMIEKIIELSSPIKPSNQILLFCERVKKLFPTPRSGVFISGSFLKIFHLDVFKMLSVWLVGTIPCPENNQDPSSRSDCSTAVVWMILKGLLQAPNAKNRK